MVWNKYWNLGKSCHNDQESKVLSSKRLFCPINSKNLKIMKNKLETLKWKWKAANPNISEIETMKWLSVKIDDYHNSYRLKWNEHDICVDGVPQRIIMENYYEPYSIRRIEIGKFHTWAFATNKLSNTI